MKRYFDLLKKKGLTYFFYQIKGMLNIIKNNPALIHRTGAFDYLSRYKYVLVRSSEDFVMDDVNSFPNKIWVCWLQGIEQAPVIVKKCVETIHKYSGDREVILLDKENLHKYVELPSFLIKKWEKGIISNTHFSDLVRITLLSEYGGIWIDSTTFLTGPIPDYLIKADLFCYKVTPYAKVVASNWMIAAAPHHIIIRLTKELLYEYWRKENKLISYSIFHLFFTMTIESSPLCQKLWHEVPYFDDVNCKIMQQELMEPFHPERFKQICQISSIHKLSYKFTREEFERPNTFYQMLIRNQN